MTPCDLAHGLADGPVAAALWDGALGRAQSPCPRTDAVVAPRALLLADTPAFYGVVLASGTLEGTVAVDDRGEVGLRLEALRYENVISAISSTYFGPGFTTLSAVRRIDRDEGAVAVVGQLVLPTAIGLHQHSFPIALDLGLSSLVADGPWEGHGQAGIAASAALSHGPTQGRVGLPLTVGGAWRPGRAFALALDLQAAFAYAAAVDHVAAAPELRFAAGPGWHLELGATVPVAGRERALLAAELRTGARL